MSHHWPVPPLLLLAVLVLVVVPAPRHLLPSEARDAYGSQVTSSGNEQRTRAGLGPVADSSCLQDFAEQQAQQMAQQQRLFHQRLEAILRACGLREVGENVAFGFRGGPATIDGWIRSPGTGPTCSTRFTGSAEWAPTRTARVGGTSRRCSAWPRLVERFGPGRA